MMRIMTENGILELEGMRFHAFHGCLEHERREGNTFIVDFRASIPISRAADSDRLEDTADYGRIYGIVKSEMEKPSDLIEHAAARIVRSIEKEFPEIAGFSIRVSKENPPVGGPVSWSRITIYGGSSRECKEI